MSQVLTSYQRHATTGTLKACFQAFRRLSFVLKHLDDVVFARRKDHFSRAVSHVTSRRRAILVFKTAWILLYLPKSVSPEIFKIMIVFNNKQCETTCTSLTFPNPLFCSQNEGFCFLFAFLSDEQ